MIARTATHRLELPHARRCSCVAHLNRAGPCSLGVWRAMRRVDNVIMPLMCERHTICNCDSSGTVVDNMVQYYIRTGMCTPTQHQRAHFTPSALSGTCLRTQCWATINILFDSRSPSRSGSLDAFGRFTNRFVYSAYITLHTIGGRPAAAAAVTVATAAVACMLGRMVSAHGPIRPTASPFTST